MPSTRSRLDATLLDRIAGRPGWTRTILCRRIAAGLLAAVAVVLFARDAVATDTVRVVVAAADLAPGSALDAADVRIAEYPPSAVPDGALGSVDEVLTHTVAGPVRAGEPLTDVRLLSSRLAESALGGSDARIVPIRLTDAGVTELLRSGDTVDVLTVGEDENDRTARVLASKAVVVLVSEQDARARSNEQVVLVAMSAADAMTVAAASLTSALTVTFH
ncbi:MAG: SAF domain-containing protein [Rhodococcus sp. (in: high G+C Gram-positive bacteria)]